MIDYVGSVDARAEAGYVAIHKWMRESHPKLGRCEWCGCTGRKTGYASASHSRYTRNRADWFEFCYPCHAAFDGVAANYRGKPRSPETIRKMSAALTGKVQSLETRAKRGASLREAYESGKLKYRIRVSDAQITEIQELAATGIATRAIARKFGISQTHARRLVKGRRCD